MKNKLFDKNHEGSALNNEKISSYTFYKTILLTFFVSVFSIACSGSIVSNMNKNDSNQNNSNKDGILQNALALFESNNSVNTENDDENSNIQNQPTTIVNNPNQNQINQDNNLQSAFASFGNNDNSVNTENDNSNGFDMNMLMSVLSNFQISQEQTQNDNQIQTTKNKNFNNQTTKPSSSNNNSSTNDDEEKDSDEQIQWNCSKCTFLNPPSNKVCEMCNHIPLLMSPSMSLSKNKNPKNIILLPGLGYTGLSMLSEIVKGINLQNNKNWNIVNYKPFRPQGFMASFTNIPTKCAALEKQIVNFDNKNKDLVLYGNSEGALIAIGTALNIYKKYNIPSTVIMSNMSIGGLKLLEAIRALLAFSPALADMLPNSKFLLNIQQDLTSNKFAGKIKIHTIAGVLDNSSLIPLSKELKNIFLNKTIPSSFNFYTQTNPHDLLLTENDIHTNLINNYRFKNHTTVKGAIHEYIDNMQFLSMIGNIIKIPNLSDILKKHTKNLPSVTDHSEVVGDIVDTINRC